MDQDERGAPRGPKDHSPPSKGQQEAHKNHGSDIGSREDKDLLVIITGLDLIDLTEKVRSQIASQDLTKPPPPVLECLTKDPGTGVYKPRVMGSRGLESLGLLEKAEHRAAEEAAALLPKEAAKPDGPKGQTTPAAQEDLRPHKAQPSPDMETDFRSEPRAHFQSPGPLSLGAQETYQSIYRPQLQTNPEGMEHTTLEAQIYSYFRDPGAHQAGRSAVGGPYAEGFSQAFKQFGSVTLPPLDRSFQPSLHAIPAAHLLPHASNLLGGPPNVSVIPDGFYGVGAAIQRHQAGLYRGTEPHPHGLGLHQAVASSPNPALYRHPGPKGGQPKTLGKKGGRGPNAASTFFDGNGEPVRVTLAAGSRKRSAGSPVDDDSEGEVAGRRTSPGGPALIRAGRRWKLPRRCHQSGGAVYLPPKSKSTIEMGRTRAKYPQFESAAKSRCVPFDSRYRGGPAQGQRYEGITGLEPILSTGASAGRSGNSDVAVLLPLDGTPYIAFHRSVAKILPPGEAPDWRPYLIYASPGDLVSTVPDSLGPYGGLTEPKAGLTQERGGFTYGLDYFRKIQLGPQHADAAWRELKEVYGRLGWELSRKRTFGEVAGGPSQASSSSSSEFSGSSGSYATPSAGSSASFATPSAEEGAEEQPHRVEAQLQEQAERAELELARDYALAASLATLHGFPVHKE